MPELTFSPVPLPYGKLAPEFSLPNSEGTLYTRSQFRNKAAVVLVFCQPTAEAWAWLESIGRDSSEYAALSVKLLAIIRAPQEALFTGQTTLEAFTLLADPIGKTWYAYTESEQAGYAAFMLDLYGGVDEQQAVQSVVELPPAEKILRWAQAAQFKCNI